MGIDCTIAGELAESDLRVQEAIALLREVSRSDLSGLSALYAWFVNQGKSRKATIHGNGCILREADDESAEIWLTLSG